MLISLLFTTLCLPTAAEPAPELAAEGLQGDWK